MTFLRPAIAALLALVLALCGFAVPSAYAVDESDLLPVDQAFALESRATDRGHLEFSWAIAKGYYLYRERLSAKADAALQPGALQLPEGIRKHDPFFGDVQIYHDRVVATLAVTPAADAKAVDVVVKYQGCADAGVCYPPQTRSLHIALPVTAEVAGNATPGAGAGHAGTKDAIAALTGQDHRAAATSDALPLPAEQAFGFEAIVDTPNRLLLRFTPAKGYYLYRDRTHFAVESADRSVQPGTPQWPPAQQRHDDHFGDVAVYTDLVEVPLPLGRSNASAQKITLRVTLQGCQIDGVCYPPMQRSVELDLPAGGIVAAAKPLRSGCTAPAKAPAAVSLLFALLLALGGGLILNLMPCVLPVLSLKALSLVQAGESPSHARRHALWYTAGVLVSFAGLGAIAIGLRQAGLALGWGFQLQQPVVVGALAYLMLAIGLSLSGVYQFGAGVAGVGQKLTEKSGPAGDFFTGVLAVVVASPCTAPFMGTAMAYAFAAPAIVGVAVFFALGLGLALPFLAIAFVPALASRLPRPGAWMETLKQVLAFPMYLTVAWLASVVAAQSGSNGVLYLLAGGVVLALGLWWWERARYGKHPIARPLALVVMVASLLALVAIERLPAAAKPMAEAGIVPYSADKLAELRASHRIVFVDMTADWCVSCKANEAAVLSRQPFKDAMANANAVYMVGDYTSVDPAITAFLEAHHAVGVPLYVVYPGDGTEGEVLPNILTQAIVIDALACAVR
jgi:thiol:disulfide interchange protein DsbD